MPDILADGNTRAAFVSTISNINSPTVAELNAGIQLQSVITADGLSGFQPSSAQVPTDALNSTANTTLPGRDQFSGVKLRFKKQSGTDTAFNTLTKNTLGFVVVRRDVLETTAWASAQAVQVYPIAVGQTGFLEPEANSLSRWEFDVSITGNVAMRASVA